MITISIWSDFACPYCYIGETRLQRAVEELGLKDDVQIELRAYELNPKAPKEATVTTIDRLASKYRISSDEAEQRIEEISNLAKDLGLDFRYATARYSNTRDAHRLMKLAESKYSRDTVSRLNEALFAAYFAENLVLSDYNMLMDKAVGAGLGREDVKNVLESDEYEIDVLIDEREAAMRGVRGVPYFVFNGSFVVPGALDIDGFKSALQRTLKRREKEAALEYAGDHA